MNEILIITISFLANPLISYVLIRKTKGTVYRTILVSLSILLLITLILAKVTDISFIKLAPNLIFISLTHLGICYLLWNLIFIKLKWIKVIGIIASSLFLLFGLFISIGSMGILKNEKVEPYLKKNINDYKVIMNIIILNPKNEGAGQLRTFGISVYKEFGPFERKILNRRYQKSISEVASKFDCTFDRERNEISLIGISKDNKELWKEIIK